MDKEMRNSYKLYRKLNLGNIFESEDSSKYNLETEELFHDSGNNSSVSKLYLETEELFPESWNNVHDNISQANMIDSYGEEGLSDFLNQQQLDTDVHEEHFLGNTGNLYGQAEHIGEDGGDFDI